MSVLGEKYEYDVFFSYAWATKSGHDDLRDWSRAVAAATARLLQLRFNVNGNFTYYLDRDINRTGMDLEGQLDEATGRSGIFVALISPYYDADYCKKEVEWFCENNELNTEALAQRVCLIKTMATPDDRWPARFKNALGKPLLYKELCDANGLPKSIVQFMEEKCLVGLSSQIEELALEIADKISSMQHYLAAREKFNRMTAPPVSPLCFFEAELTDQLRWKECSDDLKKVPLIVLPAGKPKPATAISAESDLKECAAILMLRSRSDDDFSQRIKSAYLQRRKLFLERHESVPWLLLDEIDPPPPEEETYAIPRVKVEGDWVEVLREAMRC